MLSINLRSAFLLTQLACRRMLAQERPGGSVVNIASVHTAGALPASVAYDAATWGMIGMTKSLAVELADRNLRFNAVSPGLVATRIWEDVKNAAPSHAECEAHFGSNIPIGRPIDRSMPTRWPSSWPFCSPTARGRTRPRPWRSRGRRVTMNRRRRRRRRVCRRAGRRRGRTGCRDRKTCHANRKESKALAPWRFSRRGSLTGRRPRCRRRRLQRSAREPAAPPWAAASRRRRSGRPGCSGSRR